MAIIAAILHRLEKERNKDSLLSFRDTMLTNTEQIEKLLSEIKKVYNDKTGKSYGSFETDMVLYPFSGFLLKHLQGEINFINFTKQAMNLFKQKIDPANLATGGYVLFIHYENYLMIVMLNDKGGTSIDKNTLEIMDATHLDLEKLHLASRIDLTGWSNGNENKFLSFVKGRSSSEGVSKYFRDFLGCKEYTHSKEQTLTFLRVVEDFINNKKFTSEEKQTFKQKVFDYCDEKRKQKSFVFIDNLSQYLDEENPDAFFNFANTDENKINLSFEPHRDTIRRLRRFSGRDNELTINFNANLLDKRIKYNPEKKTLLIKKLPLDLEKQLDEQYGSSQE